jgi:hypothetical protein
VARRQRLNETQIAELFEPPTEQRELVHHYTLSEAGSCHCPSHTGVSQRRLRSFR